MPDVVIDTGADVTSVPVNVAEILEVDLSSCDTTEFSGLGGVSEAYLAVLEFGIIQLGSGEEDIDGYVLGIDGDPFTFVAVVAFLPGEEHASAYLLGRMQVLRHLTLSFEEEMATIRVKSE